MPAVICPKCRRSFKVLTKAMKENGMCAACHRIWTRSFISDVVEKSGDLLGLRVRELFSLGLASDKVAATIKKEFKDFDLGTGLRPNVIVTMIDERMKDARSNP